jgi:sterol desaturase/sphingolipid hydroxylase (fatty acid hydroxylase superfamily)
MTILLSLLGSLLGAIVFVSLLEYFGHRTILHEGRLALGRDHLTHHKYFARDFYAADETAAFYDRYWVRFVFGTIWVLPLSLPLLIWVGAAAAAVVTLVGGAHALLWQWIHNEMHRPQTAWLQSTRYFRFVRDFHLGHHEKSRTNFAFVFAPVWDRVFGTYRPLARDPEKP